jgi:hypothetical protein
VNGGRPVSRLRTSHTKLILGRLGGAPADSLRDRSVDEDEELKPDAVLHSLVVEDVRTVAGVWVGGGGWSGRRPVTGWGPSPSPSACAGDALCLADSAVERSAARVLDD